MSLTVQNASLATVMSGVFKNATSNIKFNDNIQIIANLLNSSNAYYFTKFLYFAEKEIADGANLDLDLEDLGTLDVGNGAGRDNLGLTHSNTKIHALVLHNASGTSGYDLTLANNVTNGWTGFFPASSSGISLPNDGIVKLFGGETGLAVGSSSNILRVANASGNTCKLTMLMLAS